MTGDFGKDELVRIVGVFVGEWLDGAVWAVFHGSRGYEYLARRNDDMEWEFVALKDTDGQQVQLEHPSPAPDPLEVAHSLVTGEDDFTMALDEARHTWENGEGGDTE